MIHDDDDDIRDGAQECIEILIFIMNISTN